MRLIKILSIVFIGFLFACNSSNEKSGLVTVEIKYQTDSIRTSSVSWKQGMSALDALQYVARVETHPVGEYVFVSAIDFLAGERGVKGWYYKVNGQSAKVLAVHNSINPTDTITWIYKEDVCSGKVDKCN